MWGCKAQDKDTMSDSATTALDTVQPPSKTRAVRCCICQRPMDLTGLFSKYHPHKFILLEALSATGLRSIRYANEIPLVRFVMQGEQPPVS